MEIHYRNLDAEGLLRVDAKGKVDFRATVHMAREIAAFQTAHPILLDVRKLQGRLSTLEIVELVKALVADAERYKRKMALLARPDDQIERARFLETYSRNRGIPIAAFIDYEEAVTWLNAP